MSREFTNGKYLLFIYLLFVKNLEVRGLYVVIKSFFHFKKKKNTHHACQVYTTKDGYELRETYFGSLWVIMAPYGSFRCLTLPATEQH